MSQELEQIDLYQFSTETKENKTLLKYQLYRKNWSLSNGEGANEHIAKFCKGSILNVFCGKSKLGDLRLDLEPTVEPDLVMDCVNGFTIPKYSYDTVVMDPPFSYYNRFKWILNISDCARKRLIVSVPHMMIRLKEFELTDIINVVMSTGFYIRVWLVFDRKNEPLIK